MSWNNGLAGIGRVVAIVFSAGLAVASAQTVPDVTWTASTPGEGVTEVMAPGYTTFTVIGDVDGSYTLSLDKLKEGTTLKEAEAAYAEVDKAFTNPETNISPILRNALKLIDAVTEVSTAPKQTSSVGVVLEPGEYVLNGAVDAEQGTSKRTFSTLTVSGEPQAAAPKADVTVQLADFAITLPDTIKAGSQIWQVSNLGQEMHHMVLFKLNEGVTMDDFMNVMSGEQGPPPAEDAGYVGTSTSGQSSYHTFDFTPGSYVAICFLPDYAEGGDGAPHFTHGMIKNFEVVSN